MLLEQWLVSQITLSADLSPEFLLMCVFITEQVVLEETFGDKLVQPPFSSRDTQSQLTKTNCDISPRRKTPQPPRETGVSPEKLKTTEFPEVQLEPAVFSLCVHFSLCPESEPNRRPLLRPLCILHSGVYIHWWDATLSLLSSRLNSTSSLSCSSQERYCRPHNHQPFAGFCTVCPCLTCAEELWIALIYSYSPICVYRLSVHGLHAQQ